MRFHSAVSTLEPRKDVKNDCKDVEKQNSPSFDALTDFSCKVMKIGWLGFGTHTGRQKIGV